MRSLGALLPSGPGRSVARLVCDPLYIEADLRLFPNRSYMIFSSAGRIQCTVADNNNLEIRWWLLLFFIWFVNQDFHRFTTTLITRTPPLSTRIPFISFSHGNSNRCALFIESNAISTIIIVEKMKKEFLYFLLLLWIWSKAQYMEQPETFQPISYLET